MSYIVCGVSYSGAESENVPETPFNDLVAAREFALYILTEGGMFTAWVQGNGINECHSLEDGKIVISPSQPQADVERCPYCPTPSPGGGPCQSCADKINDIDPSHYGG